MKKSKIMAERIRRVRTLFRELGYRTFDNERKGSLYTATFENPDGFQAEVIIDRQWKFFEISFTFFFSVEMADFFKTRMEEMLKICYEYGCYINIEEAEKEFTFSVFSKLYFAGLNYYSLKQSLADFSDCISALTQIFEISRR